MKKLLVVLAAIFTLAMISSASAVGIGKARVIAVEPIPPIPSLESDVQIAHEYWGWSKSPYCSEESFMEKEIFWGGEEEDEGTIYEPKPCSIRIISLNQLIERVEHLNPEEPAFVPRSREYLAKALEIRCRIVAHEIGHELGLDHSTDPTNPMYTPISFQAKIAGCEARMKEYVRPKIWKSKI